MAKKNGGNYTYPEWDLSKIKSKVDQFEMKNADKDLIIKQLNERLTEVEAHYRNAVRFGMALQKLEEEEEEKRKGVLFHRR